MLCICVQAPQKPPIETSLFSFARICISLLIENVRLFGFTCKLKTATNMQAFENWRTECEWEDWSRTVYLKKRNTVEIPNVRHNEQKKMKWALKYPKPNSFGAFFFFEYVGRSVANLDRQKTTGNFCRFHSSFVFRFDTLSNGENWCAFASFALLRVKCVVFLLNEFPKCVFPQFRNQTSRTSRANRQNRTSWASSNSSVIFRMSSADVRGRDCLCLCVCVQKAYLTS